MYKNLDFIFDGEKNAKLLRERGVGFSEAIWSMNNGFILDIVPHHNQRQYPGQEIAIIEINNDAYLVPYEKKGDVMELKTVIPSRKATKKYLR